MTFKNSQYTIKVSVIISFFCQVGIGKGGIFLIERMHISLDRVIVRWNYMSALRTVYSPLNRYRKVIIYGMQIIFFASAVILQNLLTLGSLEFGMIILVFLLMTFSPILIETITEWIRKIYAKSLDKEDEDKGFFARFLERVQK